MILNGTVWVGRMGWRELHRIGGRGELLLLLYIYVLILLCYTILDTRTTDEQARRKPSCTASE
jgi:hypothetical protein